MRRSYSRLLRRYSWSCKFRSCNFGFIGSKVDTSTVRGDVDAPMNETPHFVEAFAHEHAYGWIPTAIGGSVPMCEHDRGSSLRSDFLSQPSSSRPERHELSGSNDLLPSAVARGLGMISPCWCRSKRNLASTQALCAYRLVLFGTKFRWCDFSSSRRASIGWRGSWSSSLFFF
jgi:hypothetical protein